MAKKFKQLGQGMTEYIIIVALIAVAAIAVYGFFGDTIRGQMGAVTKELAGQSSAAEVGKAQTAGGKVDSTDATDAKGLSNYNSGTTAGGNQ